MANGLIPGRPTRDAGLERGSGLSSLVPARMGRYRNLMDLVRQIRDYNADASKAISNVLRLANSGWEIAAFGADGETPDDEGRQMLEALAGDGIAHEFGGGLDVLINQLLLTAATQGAVALEIELTEGLDLYDLVAVNPWLIDFQKDGEGHWRAGIRDLGNFEVLPEVQFRYIPVDPEPGDPRGRSPFWAALDVVFFQMEVLRDLKAAAHFAGYPRIDVSVALESVVKVVESIRPDLLQPDKAEELRRWMDAYLGDIADMVDDLEPDDAFIHYDAVTSNYIVPSGRTIDIRDLIATIDAQVISGLKQLPVLLGRNEGATTTHATVQWQVFVQELRSYQRIVQRMLEWAFGTALRIWGRQGVARVEFEEIRATDRLQDAQAEESETRTKMMQVQAGWIDQDEAAQDVVGHDAVNPTPPQPPPQGGGESEDAPQGGGESGETPTGGESAELQNDENVARWSRAFSSEAHRVEDVSLLPYWQQVRHQAAEEAVWGAYREQVRAAWARMDAALRGGDVPEPGE